MAATLVVVLIAFVSNRIRYDIVALGALAFLAVIEIVPRDEAFSGFGHPAVITVAAVLVISRALENSGLVDLIARRLQRVSGRPETMVASHATVTAAFSGYMNNVGALALVMPVAIRVARRAGHPRSIILMPISFASLLGGMTTMIGTPPNVIIATAAGFSMFDFTSVGLPIAVAGILYLTLIGWRLIPRRTEGYEAAFAVEEYLTEVLIPADSPAAGAQVRELETSAGSAIRVVALLRGERRILVPSGFEVVAPGDVLLVEADADTVAEFVGDQSLEIVPAREAEQEDEIARAEGRHLLSSDEVELVEAVVRPNSMLAGRSPATLRLRARFAVNVLAVARQGGAIRSRLQDAVLRGGDVLLLQVPREAASNTLSMLGCLPLAERGIRFRAQPRILLAIAIFGSAILAAAIFSLVPIEIAVTVAALGLGAVGLVTLREAYEAIDWPVLILLGAMLPVGGALETTGAAAQAAEALSSVAGGLPPWAVIALVLAVTMTLSDVVNNAAAAVLLIPIAYGISEQLGVSSDALLMAVAVGASSAFLTPIGHQSNVLVMGPGGYQFGDYWRVGLLLEVVIVVVATPAILATWG